MISKKLDIIIELLQSIDQKLSSQSVTKPSAGSTDNRTRTAKTMTKRQIHDEALKTLERQRAKDVIRAKKKFAPEIEHLNELKKELERKLTPNHRTTKN